MRYSAFTMLTFFRPLLRTNDCSALPTFYASVRPPRVRTKSFPSSACRIYDCWFRVALGLHLSWEAYPQHSPYMRFLFVRPRVCLQLPSDSASRQTPLLFSYALPTTGRARDLHPLDFAHAGRTKSNAEIPSWNLCIVCGAVFVQPLSAYVSLLAAAPDIYGI